MELEWRGLLKCKTADQTGCEDAVKMLSVIADVHLKLVMRHGNLILYGMKPWTNLQVVEMDVTKGHAELKLTPIV